MSFTQPISINSLEGLLAQTDSITARYPMYGGAIELLYDADAHSYMIERDGERILVPGVTSITGTMDKPALVPWAVKLAAEYITQKMLSVSYLKDNDPLQRRIGDIDYDQFLKWVTEAKADYRRVSRTALDVGHLAHEWLEDVQKAAIKDNTSIKAVVDSGRFPLPVVEPDLTVVNTIAMPMPLPPNMNASEEARQQRAEAIAKAKAARDVLAEEAIKVAEKNTSAVQNCCNAAVEWMLKHNFRPVRVENKVYSRLYNFAGTFDDVAIVDSCGDAKCCAVVRDGYREALNFKDLKVLSDWKSSKGMYDEYRFQTAAYWQAYAEEFGEELGARIVVKLGKEDGKVAAFFLPNEDQHRDFGAFIGLQTAYERVQEVKKMMDELKIVERAEDKAEREAKKQADKEAKAAAKKQKKETVQ